ncbi:protein phosphatase 2C domain-containing protein [Streptomyces sp. CAU 1734]|uniref:protein phosphatase 2C domain-containing protein n=1 Tax=Streptomyces sp. CAU 1734 TaxID=3140360 RepID=UPI0032601D3F
MSQQVDDDWWDRLYDASAPDTGPTRTAGDTDTLDTRFDSASGAVTPAVPDPREDTAASADRPEAGPEPKAPAARDVADVLAELEDPAAGAEAPPPPRPAEPVPPRPPVTRPRTAPAAPAVTAPAAPVPPEPAAAPRPRAPWEPPLAPPQPPPAYAPLLQPPPAAPPGPPPGPGPEPRRSPPVTHIGDRPPTYDPEPTALVSATPENLGGLVADTVLDGARYGGYLLRAASVRGDSARYRGEPRRDALLTARFGTGRAALVLVAVAAGNRGAEEAHRAAADACQWIGQAVARSHPRLSEDIRAGRRGELKSGLHRLTDRTLGRLRTAGAGSADPGEQPPSLRCLLLSADPACRTRVFFGAGPGGLFRLRDGAWHDIEPSLPDPATLVGDPVVGYGSPPGTAPADTPAADRPTNDPRLPAPPAADASPPPAEPFRFRASIARPGDTLLLCGPGFADPMRSEPALGEELAARWAAPGGPPGLTAFLTDVQLRVKGYADDRTAAAVWEQ